MAGVDIQDHGMAADKASAEHVDHKDGVDHEAALTGAVALASLFSNCVEAFNLILPGHKWEREEQLLLCRLGIQQARLLIWGAVVGVTSPPGSVTDRAVPKHPSAAYPDLKEPTFFGPRDARLDEQHFRQGVEDCLSAIVDRSSGISREEMMEKYGLKPPKKFSSEYQPALDINRLEQFRELWELLREVAESYAHISARRSSSITRTSWTIADTVKFSRFVTFITEKIDALIEMMDVQEKIDRGMGMDIKALGWHLSVDRNRIATDVSKLKLIQEICKTAYPDYLPAVQTALDNIEREQRENVYNYNPYASAMATPANTTQPSASARRGSTPLAQVPQANGSTNGANVDKHKRQGLLGGFFKGFGKSSKRHEAINAGRSKSVSAASTGTTMDEQDTSDPPRALSDTGPFPHSGGGEMPDLEPVRSQSVGAILETPTEQVRSKSVGDILDVRPETEEEKVLVEKLKLHQVDTEKTVKDDVGNGEAEGAGDGGPVESTVSRHDQFHGLGRQGTKTQW